MKKDDDLRKDVEIALVLKLMLNGREIGVIAKNGVITLTGAVDNDAMKYEAEDTAKKVDGVVQVIQKIESRFETKIEINKENIVKETLNTIKNNIDNSNENVKVKVEIGKATLEGVLHWSYQKELKKSPEIQFFGKKDKQNEPTMKTETKDEIEQKEIENALVRNWSIDEENVHVKVTENRVTLKGTVHSLYQREEAERIASTTPGVSAVENELVIDYK